VDADNGDSGNKARDRKMKKEILETQDYPDITFTPRQVKGAIASQGKSQLELDGIMVLHGQSHPMEMAVPLTVSGDTVSADIPFEIPYVKWGLKNPSTLFLRVSEKVEINVHVVGRFTER
jgi:polyisoprenoid-binding protein YceI